MTTKKDPILKQIETISDSNKKIQKEINTISKIFVDNQKMLSSMKNMMDTLTLTIQDIQKQSKQIKILEEDTQKIYTNLNKVKIQSNIITNLDSQITKLQEEITKINSTEDINQQVEDSANAIKNNSKMIIRIAQRIDDIKDSLRKVSKKADSIQDVKSDIKQLKKNVTQISSKTDKFVDKTKIKELKVELEKLNKKAATSTNVNSELNAIKIAISKVSEKSVGIDSLKKTLDDLKIQFDDISRKTKTVDSNTKLLNALTKKINTIEISLSQIGDTVKDDLLKDVEEKISHIITKQDKSISNLHEKSVELFSDIKSTSKSSSDSLMMLLKYQSSMNMITDTKYGGIKELENMISQTVNTINTFTEDQDVPLPYEVSQWALSKIFECADKWEIKFNEVYSILTSIMDKNTIKESIKIQQIRDIYGIRAVDKIRNDLI